MKKTLCWLIVLAMLVGLMPAVFATEGNAEESVATNVMVDGDNAVELEMGNPDPVVYTYTATQTGTLYVELTAFAYTNEWTDEPYPMDDFLSDVASYYCSITVNGEALQGGYFGFLEVVEGDTVSIAFTNMYADYYGYIGSMNLGYTNNLPVPGVDAPLTPALVDMNEWTPEIPAGEGIAYKISYETFSGYVLQIYGDVSISFTYFSYELYEDVEVVIEDVDGVLEYSIDEYSCDEFTLTNNGTEAASFRLAYYAPEGSRYNPIEVEKLEDIHITAEAEVYVDVYYTWTSDVWGTILADYVDYILYINFTNETTGQSGKYDSTTKQFSVHVNPGDKLTMNFSGSNYDAPIDYTFVYSFVEGDPIGSIGNPIATDLEAGLSVNVGPSDNIYYSWTPAQSAVVTIGFTSASSYNTNVPTVTVNGEAYTLGEELTVTAGKPVVFAVSFSGSYGSARGTLLATVVEVIEDPVEVENPMIIGDNAFEIGMGYMEPVQYNFVATETGRLFVVVSMFEYCSQWSNGEYQDMGEYLYDLVTYCEVTVNGEPLVGNFFGFIDVVEGEVYSIVFENQNENFGYRGTLTLSYTDNLPVPGIDTPLTPALVDAFGYTVEIPAGESVQYELSYYAFSGYIFRLEGDLSISYSYEDYSTWPATEVQVTVEDVNGILDYDIDEAGAGVLTITNNGTEATSFKMSYYAPEGSRYNPIRVENLEDIHATSEPQEYMDLFYVWTADKTGTIMVNYDYLVYVNFYNVTSETYGQMDYENYIFMIHVYEGDELNINLSGSSQEGIDYWFTYTFLEGEPVGSQGNPIETDLLAGQYLESLYNETIYYTWTPAEDATVTITYTDSYGGTNVPVVTINGEAYTLGEEITVTAGEALVIGVTAGDFYLYGTLQAFVAQPDVPVTPPEIPEGEILVEDTVNVPASWSGTSVSHEVPGAGTATVVITGYPEGASVEYAFYVKGTSGRTYHWTHNGDFMVTVDVAAGDTVKLELCVLGENGNGAYVGGDVSYTIVFNAAEGGGEEPELEGSGTYSDPFIIDSIDDIHFVAAAGEAVDYYYQWTATEMGTLFVTVDERAMLGMENITSYQWCTAISDYEASIFVEAGDVVLINIYEYSDEAIDCVPTYEFVPGYPVGHPNNPAVVDLFEGVAVTLDWEAEYHMIWTPAEDATVTIDFTVSDRWSTAPAITVNGETYTFGDTINVTAGEAVTIVLVGSMGWGSNGTIQATAVEGGEEVLAGDANGDGTVNFFDAIMILQYATEEEAEGINLEGADMNGDGVINFFDAIMILQYATEG